MSSILEKPLEKYLQNSHINILKNLLKKATIQWTNSFFRKAIHHKTAERQTMLCTNWGPKFSILARNPDMNPIENVFSYVRRKLHEEFHNRNITFENFEDFSAHAEKTLFSQSQWTIDYT